MLPQKTIKLSFYFLILLLVVMSPVMAVPYCVTTNPVGADNGLYSHSNNMNYLRIVDTYNVLTAGLRPHIYESIIDKEEMDSYSYESGFSTVVKQDTSAVVGNVSWTISEVDANHIKASFHFTDWSSSDVIGTTAVTSTFVIGDTNLVAGHYRSSVGDGAYISDVTRGLILASDSNIFTYCDDISDVLAPVANFTGTPTSGSLPLTVQFNDTSTNTPTYWSWDFGDGYYYSGTSAFAQNPTHIYNSIGLYNVSLYVQNTDGGDSETKVGYINASAGIPASYNFRCLIYDTSYNAIDGATFNIAYYNNTTIQTDTTHNGGYVYFTVPNYQMIYGNVSKAGYEQTDFIINFGTIYNSHQMLYHSWETPGIPPYYGTLMLSVLDSTTLTGIPFAKIDVYTDDNGTTKIDTQYTDSSGWGWAMTEPLNQELYYVVSHPSYTTKDFTYNMTYSPAYYSLLLTKTGQLPETYGYSLTVTGIDAISGSMLSNAWFTVSSTSNIYNNYAAKTNSTGIAVIGHIPPGTYYLTSLLSGYYPTNQTVSILANSTRTVYLSPYTGTPIPTFTPVQTPIWTGPGGVPGNAIEGLYNFVMFLGIGQLAAGVLIGLCITCGCAIALAIFAGGTGAMLGACVGFIGCCVIGFFPIWLLFIAVILIFAVFFIFRNGSEE